MALQAKRVLNQNGFSLLGHMMTLSVLIVTFIGVSQLITYQHKQHHAQNLKVTATTLQSNVMAAFQGEAAWEETLEKNRGITATGMECLADPGVLCPVVDPGNPGYPLIVIGDQNPTVPPPDDTVFYDSNLATSGFSDAAVPCQAFDSGDGNPDCPFRVNLFWKPDCVGAACNPSLITITGELVYNSLGGPVTGFAPEAFNIQFVRVVE